MKAGMELIIIGSGNGFEGTSSNFIIRYKDRRIWIDPACRPHEKLAHLNLNWRDITDYIISHNHEDHIEGFTAVLERHIEEGQKLSLLTTSEIYNTLEIQFGDLFNDNMRSYIDFTELDPAKIINYHGAKIETRFNHHIVPAGTIGFKISYNGKTLGISGDTKYDEEINKKLDNPKLSADWFADCDLILHEVDFSSPQTIHTTYDELMKLMSKVKGKLLVYHTVQVKEPFELAREGACYQLLNKQIKEISLL